MWRNEPLQTSTSASATVQHDDPREHAALLISRYPELSSGDKAELIKLYRSLSPVDVALLLSDDALRKNLDRFTADHRKVLRTPFRQYAVLVVIAALAFALVAWVLLGGI